MYAGFKKTYTVLGDSISVRYSDFLSEALSDEYIFIPKTEGKEAYDNLDIPTGTNCGDSGMLLDYIKASHENGRLTSDFYILNAGLHDIKTDPITGKKQVEINEYEKNLREIFRILKIIKKCKFVFVNTTNADEEIHNNKGMGFYRFKKDVALVNEAAKKVCNEYKIPYIDLYSYTLEFGKEAFSDHVHYFSEISKKQAEFLAEEVLKL